MPSHRAERGIAAARRPSGHLRGTSDRAAAPAGRRRAEQPARRSSRRRPGGPSALTIAGVTALALAGLGTLSGGVAQAGPAKPVSRHAPMSARASGLTGTSRIAGAELDRGYRVPSRDSEREALRDRAADTVQDPVEMQAKEHDAALVAPAASPEKQAGRRAGDAWQLPVTHGVYHLTSRFGDCSSLWSHCHTGLDFAAPTGTPIHAIADGTITATGWAGSYGNRTIMRLPDGAQLWYAHQSAFEVKPGEKVAAGQVIGLVGATGNTTGPHVHIEVRPGAGDPVDPFAAMVAHGLKP